MSEDILHGMESPQSILEYWFGTEDDDAVVARQQASLWWSHDPEVDAEIRRRFLPLVQRAAAGALDGWNESPEGRLALIIVTDQLPRNIFRGSSQAFASDEIALRLSLEGLARRVDRLLRPIHRVFFYLPLEHSEQLEHQVRCVALFRELATEVADEQATTFAGFLDYAEQHHAIIERFGRFPHRNGILGRDSTPEEIEFLQQPGSSF